MLYRVFPLVPGAGVRDPGGPLHVPRIYQGSSRHDNPSRYGALYASREALSAVAEWLRRWRGQELRNRDLLRADGARMALVSLDDRGLDPLLSLDDPRILVARTLRPSEVATRDRRRTRPVALAIYEDGHPGFEWWSTLEGSWINVTLFEDRSVDRLEPAGDPEPLTADHPAMIEAADAVSVRLAA